MLSKGHGVHNARFHRLIGFGRGHGGRHATHGGKRIADTARGADAHAFEIGQRRLGIAGANEVVLRHGRGHQQLGVPLRHLVSRRGVCIDGRGHSALLFEVLDPEEGQFQHGDHAVFVAVIARAELRHLECSDRDPVEVLAVFRQAAIADIHGEFAVCLFADQFGQLFDMLGKGAALAPDGDVPFCGRSFQREGARNGANNGADSVCVH